MTAGFVIWSSVTLLLIGIGIWAWRSKKAFGFYAGVRPPEVSDVAAYNHSVALLWFVYAVLFEALGLPLLFLKQNAALLLLPLFGTVLITIGLMVCYHRILQKYERKDGTG